MSKITKLNIIGTGMAKELSDNYWHDYTFVEATKGVFHYYFYFHDTYSGIKCWQKISKWQLRKYLNKYSK